MKYFITIAYYLVFFSTTISYGNFFFDKDSLLTTYKNRLKLQINNQEKATIYQDIAIYFDDKNSADSAFYYYTKAKSLFKKSRQLNKVAECNIELFELLSSQKQLGNNKPKRFLNEYYHYALKNNDTLKLIEAQKCYALLNFDSINYPIAKQHYNKALKLASQIKNTAYQTKIYSNLGLLYSTFISLDSAHYFIDKTIELAKKDNNQYSLCIAYINYANSYSNNPQKAIEYLEKANSIQLTKHKLALKEIIYQKLAHSYAQTSEFDKAFTFQNKYQIIKDSINYTKQNETITDIKEQYDNERLRADNLEMEAKRKRSHFFYISALLILLFGIIIALQANKNIKRKQKLAEQEKELQTQKLATFVREQELINLDAMIAGQEKERQHIANDLHDDLGGLLTSLKWHFEALEKEENSKKTKKVSTLLEEVYQKVRSISHLKSASVMTNKTLLKAVKDMAKSITESNTITIEVFDFGVDSLLESSLELSIFRTLQELITNILKHANATEVAIHITNHKDSINIMVEDNGIGFNPKIISKKQGMGIKNIEKRIESLDGQITIESEKNKGTTIIIDIPL